MLWVRREQGCGCVLEQVFSYKEPIPLRDFRPGLCFQLVFRVGRDDALCVLIRRDRPQNKPGHEAGLADPMAAGCGDLDCLIDREQPVFDLLQGINLPIVWAIEVLKFAFAPRERCVYKADRVSGKLSKELNQFAVVLLHALHAPLPVLSDPRHQYRPKAQCHAYPASRQVFYS